INMTVERWLVSDKSYQAGTGIGLVSGAKIMDVPKKKYPVMVPEKYEEYVVPHFPIRDLDRVMVIGNHMRKVRRARARHLAQEDHHLKETKITEELANTKSTI
ncbi:uncharacterized protein BJ212DRAFT_1241414, partial [Suillus subaureus]